MNTFRSRHSQPFVPLFACYDISHPKRLVVLHRQLTRELSPVQFSVFEGCLHASRMQAFISGIHRLIDAEEDDVRLYTRPPACQGVLLGAHAQGNLIYDRNFRLYDFDWRRPNRSRT